MFILILSACYVNTATHPSLTHTSTHRFQRPKYPRSNSLPVLCLRQQPRWCVITMTMLLFSKRNCGQSMSFFIGFNAGIRPLPSLSAHLVPAKPTPAIIHPAPIIFCSAPRGHRRPPQPQPPLSQPVSCICLRVCANIIADALNDLFGLSLSPAAPAAALAPTQSSGLQGIARV